MKQGVLCQSEVISMAIWLPVSSFGLEYFVRSHLVLCFLFHVLFSDCLKTQITECTVRITLEKKNVLFLPALLQSTVHENKISSRNSHNLDPGSKSNRKPKQMQISYFNYDFSPRLFCVYHLTASQYESMKMATAFVKPEGISASRLDSN